MPAAYVDTSCLLAMAFAEETAVAVRRRLDRFDPLVSSNLLEAEVRAAFRREGIQGEPAVLSGITWVMPGRALSRELTRVFEAGTVRVADAWHLAAALYVSEDSEPVTFLTLDTRQRAVAAALGFPT